METKKQVYKKITSLILTFALGVTIFMGINLLEVKAIETVTALNFSVTGVAINLYIMAKYGKM